MTPDPACSDGTTDTVVDWIAAHAASRPDHPALVVLGDGESESSRWSYRDLETRARELSIGLEMHLAAHGGAAGQRVLVLLPTSAEYVLVVLACFMARALPVPLNTLVKDVHTERVDGVLADCTAALAITDRPTPLLEQLCAKRGVALITTADLANDFVPDRAIDPANDPAAEGPFSELAITGGPSSWDVAYLQYTSGSTSVPRGVVVGHDQLLHQCAILAERLGFGPDDVTVSWLPLFHDFGLIAGLIMPLTQGATSVLLPPTAFAQRPARWLRAISRYRATATFGPNFPLELCVERVSESDAAGLDLSSLRTMGLGAEPVRPATTAAFIAAFAPRGLCAESLRPLYGLAEATLVVTCSAPSTGEPWEFIADTDAYEHGRVEPAGTGQPGRRLIGHGGALRATEVVIADPTTWSERPDGHEGEILVAGKTVARGYWNRVEETTDHFGVHLSDGRGPFLRTGDLGARVAGHLLVTARTKDLMVIRGRNLHPQDVELTASAAHPGCAPGLAIAFSVDDQHEEQVVLVAELRRATFGQYDPRDIAQAVHTAVTDEHDVVARTVVLIAPSTLPRTTSGKVRRSRCRQLFLAGELATEYVSGIGGPPAHTAASAAADETSTEPGWYSEIEEEVTETEVLAWLRETIAELITTATENVDPSATFGALGLDSAAQLGLTGRLADWLGRGVDPTLLYEDPTVAGLARAVTGGTATPPRTAVPTPATAGPHRNTRHRVVSVVGMAAAVPGAASTSALWRLLRDGREAISSVPPDRWDTAGRDPRLHWGGFLDDIAGFDAPFFGINAEEANAMDPQQRLLLTTTWRALEDAGLTIESLAGSRTGVFIGISGADYYRRQAHDQVDPSPYAATGNALSVAANRISYLFDLHGPSMAVDTACSSSLVALHQARESLLRGECDQAVVGGVNLLLDPDLCETLAQAGMTSPSGHCATFDASADGYVRSEGCVVVVLARSDDERGDEHPYGLVLGSAIDHDGRSNTLTAPSRFAQERVMRLALATAGIEPSMVDYVEAHGTGTPLGDPVEVAGIAEVYGRAGDNPLMLRSSKANVGHLESAAGLTGLVSALLALRHATVPAHRHTGALSPRLPLAGTRIRICGESVPWPATAGRPRTAAVSSFGFGGTNAHVVLQAAPDPSPPHPAPRPSGDESSSRWSLLPLSARSSEALDTLAGNTADALGDLHLERFPAFCSAAVGRRSHLPVRAAVVACSARDAAERARWLATPTTRRPRFIHRGEATSRGPGPVAFLVPGQGVVRPGMSRCHYEHHLAFRAALDELDELAAPRLGVSLVPTLTGHQGEPVDLAAAVFGQTAAFLTTCAAARMWQHYGVRPDFVLGHSLGEYAAGVIAGVLDPASALDMIVMRARSMAASPRGAMYAILTERMTDLLADLDAAGPEVTLASSNAIDHATISGPADQADALAAAWTARGARVVRLNIDRACHTPLMNDTAAALDRVARTLEHRAPTVPMVAAADAEFVGAAGLPTGYWARQTREPVRFAESVELLRAAGVQTWVEVGGDPVLTALARRTATGEATWIATGRHDDGDDRAVLDGLAAYYTAGGTPNWSVLAPPGSTTRETAEELPGHPLRTTRHWYRAPNRPVAALDDPPGELPGRRLDVADPIRQWFAATISPQAPAHVQHHQLFGIPVLPAATMILWAAQVIERVRPHGPAGVELTDITFPAVLDFSTDQARPVQAVATDLDADTTAIRCVARGTDSQAPGAWSEHVIVGAGRRAHPSEDKHSTPHELLDGHATACDVTELRAHLHAAGLTYGPQFHGLERLSRFDDMVFGQVTMPDQIARSAMPGTGAATSIPPPVLDACFQAAAALDDDPSGAPVPVGVDRVVLHRAAPATVGCLARRRPHSSPGAHDLCVDLTVSTPDGDVVAEFLGLRLHRVSRPATTTDTTVPQVFAPHWVPDDTTPEGPEVTGAWLVVAPHRLAARTWTRALASAGATHTYAIVPGAPAHTSGMTTTAAPGPEVTADPVVHLNGDTFEWLDEDDLETAVALLPKLTGIVATDEADPRSNDRASADTDRLHPEVYLDFARRLLAPMRHVLSRATAADARVVVIGSGGDVVGDQPASSGIEQDALRTLGLVVTAEYGAARCARVDLDAHLTGDAGRVAALQRALASDRGDVLARRNERWWRQELAPALPAPSPTPTVRPGATYLITGGFGGLGRATAHWLVDQGADRLVLVGRTTPAQEPTWLSVLRAAGTQVRAAAVDVGNEDAVDELLRGLRQQGASLRGIIHAAGTVDDGAFESLAISRYEPVARSKVHGAWNLHRHAPGDLDFFLLYSSIASLIGSPGQANYVLANAYLDGLARHRHASGMPATAIAWGPWSEQGLAARPEVLSTLERRGLHAMPNARALEGLHAVLATAVPCAGVADVDWARQPVAVSATLAAGVEHSQPVAEASTHSGSIDPADLEDLAMTDPAAATAALITILLQEILGLLGHGETGRAELTRDFGGRPLHSLGLDSLNALQLRSRLSAELRVEVPTDRVFDGSTAEDVARTVVDELAARRVLSVADTGQDDVEEFSF